MRDFDPSAWKPTFGWKRALNCVRQTEAAECGLACLTMIANYYGNESDISHIRSLLGHSSNGSNLATLVSSAEKLGLQSRGLRVDLEEIDKLILPCIIHFDLNHFVVLVKVKGGSVTLADPAVGMRKISRKAFSSHFTGVVLELLPEKNFAKSKKTPKLSVAAMVFNQSGVKNTLANIFIFSLLLELIALSSPLMVQTIIDQVIVNRDYDLLLIIALSFMFLLLVQIMVSAVRSWTILALGLNLSLSWSGSVFSHLMKLPESYYQKRHLGDLVSKFGSLEIIQQTLTNKTTEVILDGLMASLSLFMLFYYSQTLALITISSFIVFICIRLFYFGILRERNLNIIGLSARQQSAFLETLRGSSEIKLNNARSLMSARYLNKMVSTNNASASIQSLNLIFGAADSFIFGSLKIAVLSVGAISTLKGSLSAGMLVAYLAYSDQFIGRVTSLVDFSMQIRMLGMHSDRVADIVLSKVESNLDAGTISPAKPSSSPAIYCSNVSFRYSENEPWIIKNCSFSVAPGESLCITGPSGCGKSTLLKILSGLIDPTSGALYINGVDIRQTGKEYLRSMTSVVMQDSVLFTGSISENISFFESSFNTSEIEEAAKIAEIHDEICAMPMRYQSLVGDMGSSLSGGQKQRICLARALYRKPSCLLLDEATSHLDIPKEKAITKSIKQLNMTRIFVSHRPETIRSADRILYLVGGNLIDPSKGDPMNEATVKKVLEA